MGGHETGKDFPFCPSVGNEACNKKGSPFPATPEPVNREDSGVGKSRPSFLREPPPEGVSLRPLFLHLNGAKGATDLVSAPLQNMASIMERCFCPQPGGWKSTRYWQKQMCGFYTCVVMCPCGVKWTDDMREMKGGMPSVGARTEKLGAGGVHCTFSYKRPHSPFLLGTSEDKVQISKGW